MPIQQRARFEFVGISPSEMRQIGGGAIALNLRRWDRAQDLGDQPAKPLSMKYQMRWKKHQLQWMSSDRGYRAQKARKGLRPVRDLRYTGDLRRAMGVLQAQRNRAVLGALDEDNARKLYFNQRRWRMFGISPKDTIGLKSILSNFHPIKAVIVNG